VLTDVWEIVGCCATQVSASYELDDICAAAGHETERQPDTLWCRYSQTYGKSGRGAYQTTALPPPKARAKPMIPPTAGINSSSSNSRRDPQHLVSCRMKVPRRGQGITRTTTSMHECDPFMVSGAVPCRAAESVVRKSVRTGVLLLLLRY
jgi:hypothetical protein